MIGRRPHVLLNVDVEVGEIGPLSAEVSSPIRFRPMRMIFGVPGPDFLLLHHVWIGGTDLLECLGGGWDAFAFSPIAVPTPFECPEVLVGTHLRWEGHLTGGYPDYFKRGEKFPLEVWIQGRERHP